MGTSVVRVDEKKLNSKRAELQAMVSAIVVRDAETCLTAKTAQRDIRLEVKMVHAVLDPFVAQAKDAYDKAKEERAKYIDPLQKLDEQLDAKVSEYNRLERERAQREQDEINRQKREREAREADERRKEAERQAEEDRKRREKEIAEARKAGELKAAEAKRLQKIAEEEAERKRQQAKLEAEAEKANFQEVTVKPNLVTVSGVPNTRSYRFEILDITKIPREFLYPTKGKEGKYDPAKFPAIGDRVRGDKDPKKSMMDIPGIRCWEE